MPGKKAHHGFSMAESRVVVIRSKKSRSESGEIDLPSVRRMLARGFELMSQQADEAEGIRSLFSPGDRIGIKINTIGGRSISTRPELALALAHSLSQGGIQERNILIWDRTDRELREAGYRLSTSRAGIRTFGTDRSGAGYGAGLISHLNIGSLFSTIQTNFSTASISLAILKDHGLAGVTAGMKNYFGAIHNPNKYHDTRCDPFVAEVFDTPPIKNKHRLSILDALLVQYHRGPSYHPQWAARYGGLVFSTDPVAADRVGWDIIEKLRAAKDLPSLKEEGREPTYLYTARSMGTGRIAPSEIEVIEEEI
jgi:uncharacterized protein (DUF362 family)